MADRDDKYAVYDEIVETQCKSCRQYKPRKKGNCAIYKSILRGRDGLARRYETLVIVDGKCRGYEENA